LGSLVLLIVLLPGVLFFVGVYLPEEFTRDSEERSPLGQLAAALLVSFVVHGVAYALLAGDSNKWLPAIDLEIFLRTVALETTDMTRVATAMHQMRWWILLYVIATSAVGVLLGNAYGRLAVGRLSAQLARHPWVFDLSTKGLTFAHVLTNVRQGERVLLYKGFLKAFGLQRNGQLSYVVLRDVRRLYLVLGSDAVSTSDSPHQRDIGRSASSSIVDPLDGGTKRQRSHSYLLIEGEDIANIVFDRLKIGDGRLSSAAFDEMARRASAPGQLSADEQAAAKEIVGAMGSEPGMRSTD